MNVSGVIAAIPKMDAKERRTLRDRATAWVEGGSKDQADAAKVVLEALDDAEKREGEELVRHIAGLDKAQRVVEAFTKAPLSDHERHVVQVLLDNPGFSSEALTQQAGWGGQAWHMHFGELCRDRVRLLWPAPFEESRSSDFYSGILADFDSGTRGFTMKPEAVEGFRRIGVAPRDKR